MVKDIEIAIHPDNLDDEKIIKKKLTQAIDGSFDLLDYRLRRKSIDARQKQVVFRLLFLTSDEPLPIPSVNLIDQLEDVSNQPSVIIVGAGPAGYFAALECIQLGLKPLVFDRGKDVRERRRDLRAIQQEGVVNPHSNYCFGEGGAGTYSDGKLYTRSHKRGKIQNILEWLVAHGATEEILTDAHPHIGSNKLPGIISNIRNTIESKGGEVCFNAFVTDIHFNDNTFHSIELEDGTVVESKAMILATGHSARDIFYLLKQKSIRIEAKDFALGVRVEHPQKMVDLFQYKQMPRHEKLPAASYSLVVQVDEKGVFSFCNCPGGLIVPAATAPGEIVVNGMSLSKRDSPFSNSGFVTAVSVKELKELGYEGDFAVLEFQKKVEQDLFDHGDGSQKGPAQKVSDFIENRTSTELNETSYIPGLYPAPLHEILPDFIVQRLQKAFKELDKKMPGFSSDKAQIVGTESRTSSPIRIPRNPSTFMHPDFTGFFPCGEGAGYAGGILSAAMDGQNVSKGVLKFYDGIE